METVVVAFDVDDAYNGVDYVAIIAGLEASKVNPWLVRMESRVAIRFEGWTSVPKHICSGLPQGSPLSPV